MAASGVPVRRATAASVQGRHCGEVDPVLREVEAGGRNGCRLAERRRASKADSQGRGAWFSLPAGKRTRPYAKWTRRGISLPAVDEALCGTSGMPARAGGVAKVRSGRGPTRSGSRTRRSQTRSERQNRAKVGRRVSAWHLGGAWRAFKVARGCLTRTDLKQTRATAVGWHLRRRGGLFHFRPGTFGGLKAPRKSLIAADFLRLRSLARWRDSGGATVTCTMARLRRRLSRACGAPRASWQPWHPAQVVDSAALIEKAGLSRRGGVDSAIRRVSKS